jgi:membrane protein implicated in regulation of membrane protease activity
MAWPGRLLAAGVLAVALALLAWQWFERRRRPASRSQVDVRHFARQDLRRLLGAGVMGLIALTAWQGAEINPRAGRHEARLWASSWLLVAVLVLLLLALALLDLLSIRLYARRHRRDLAAQQRAAIAAERRRLFDPDTGDGRRPPPDVL